MFQSRTHTCNELRMENVGEKVKIVGWMENVREVGNNFAFVVVRDFYGTTQVVVENAEMMGIVKSINKESTISVEGVVRERASKNPKLPTGDVEVVPEKIEILGKCRYNDCAHLHEPDCAVLQALKDGQIEPSRHASYARLYESAKEIKLWEHKLP